MKKFSLPVFLFFVIIFCFTQFLLCDSVLVADDLVVSLINPDIKIFKYLDYGSWVMYVQNVLLYVIPDKLNYNLMDWCTIVGSLFKTSIITGIFIYIYKILKKNDNTILNSIVMTFILYMIFFILHLKIHFVDFIINEGFFRFILPSFLMEVFLYYFYLFYNNAKINVENLKFLALLSASSSEVIATILSLVVFFTYLWKKDKKILSVLYALILGGILLASTKGFQAHFSNKFGGIDWINIPSIIEYGKIFFKNVILNYISLYIILTILILTNRKNFKYPIFIMFSTLIFFFLLFFIGKTDDGNFFLYHCDIYSFLIMSLILSIAYSYKNQNIKIIILLMLFIIYPFINASIAIKNKLLNTKNFSYARDKIRLFYEYKDTNLILMPEFTTFRLLFIPKTNYKINIYHNDITVPVSQLPIQLEFYTHMNNGYYINIYKCKKGRIIVFNKNALNLFLEQGGTLDEVQSGKYKFSDLTDKNFVLNNKDKI